jgi:hypothetical protein
MPYTTLRIIGAVSTYQTLAESADGEPPRCERAAYPYVTQVTNALTVVAPSN